MMTHPTGCFGILAGQVENCKASIQDFRIRWSLLQSHKDPLFALIPARAALGLAIFL